MSSNDTDLQQLAASVQRLEDIEAIKVLKHRHGRCPSSRSGHSEIHRSRPAPHPCLCPRSGPEHFAQPFHLYQQIT